MKKKNWKYNFPVSFQKFLFITLQYLFILYCTYTPAHGTGYETHPTQTKLRRNFNICYLFKRISFSLFVYVSNNSSNDILLKSVFLNYKDLMSAKPNKSDTFEYNILKIPFIHFVREQ